jgi:hypothetical protein
MSERCGYAYDKSVGRYWFPQCMGGAVYGLSGCTCAPKSAKRGRDDLLRRIDVLERRVERLEGRNASQH